MHEAGFDNISSFRRIEQVRKRDGKLVPYDINKIAMAVNKAMYAGLEAQDPDNDSMFIAKNVQSAFMRAATLVSADAAIPSVEAIQDAIERELMLHGYTKTAKAFILYREERAKARAAEQSIPEHVKLLNARSRVYFRNLLSEFVYYRTYSRWIEKEGRRETWVETVNRFMDFMMEVVGQKISVPDLNDVCQAILKMEVMPSMRLMWSAGDAARATNVSAFNCAFIAPSRFQDFAEILYILACGTGVGFSVESRNVQQLPIVKQQTGLKDLDGVYKYRIDDSKEGWADALVHGIRCWYDGLDVEFDFSLLRPEGARLKTMGGRSSGPKPLMDLLAFTRSKILSRQGRRLTNLDVHDIVCKIGDCIVAGGVRRSALISLSDLDDEDMRHAKDGHFFITNNQRQLANNSAVYEEKPSAEMFMREWLALVQSRSGERGIFNRGGLSEQIPLRRKENWQQNGHMIDNWVRSQVGTNPCGEINLLSKQFCNLTEVICRPEDTKEDLLRKVRIASILGTYQSMLTNYPYLSKDWQTNCESERLLGVSLTGQWDCPVVRHQDVLMDLKHEAVNTNRRYSELLGIPMSTAITCIKPSGTVSQLTDSSPGMHPRHSPYYIRRIRISASDPLYKMLKDQGLPYYPEVGQTYDMATTFVFEFPVKSPESTHYRNDLSALEQLEYWKMVKRCFTEHNPSVTISVGEDEWIDVQGWIWDNWYMIGGLSFLPREDTVYKLAPYEEITEERYMEMVKTFPAVDFSQLVTYEREDNTQGSKELACVAGVCEI